MKNGVKIVLVLAVTLGVAGTGMAIGGAAAGAVRAEEMSGEAVKGPFRWLREIFSEFGQVRHTTEWETGDAYASYDSEEMIDWKSFGSEEMISRIEVTADAANVRISMGNSDLAGEESEDIPAGEVVVKTCRRYEDQSEANMEVNDGVLYITEEHDGETSYQKTDTCPEITVYLPEGMCPELKVASTLGSIELEEVSEVSGLDLSAGTGNIYIENEEEIPVRIAGDALLSCNVGEIDAYAMECLGNMQVSMNIGDTELEFWDLEGDLNVESATGDVDVTLPRSAGDGLSGQYNYSLTASLGEISCTEWELYETLHSDMTDAGNYFSDSGVGQKLQLTNNPEGSNITVQNQLGDISVSSLYE